MVAVCAVEGERLVVALSASHRPGARKHLAVVRVVELPPTVGGSFEYPSARALCGARTWGPAGVSESADCARCLRVAAR